MTKGPPERPGRYITDKNDWYCMEYSEFAIQMANMLKGSMEALEASITQLARRSVAKGDPTPVVLVAPDGSKVMLAIDDALGKLYLCEYTAAPNGYWGARLTVIDKK